MLCDSGRKTALFLAGVIIKKIKGEVCVRMG